MWVTSSEEDFFLHKLEFKNKINGGEYSEVNYSTEKLTQGAVVDLWQTD